MTTQPLSNLECYDYNFRALAQRSNVYMYACIVTKLTLVFIASWKRSHQSNITKLATYVNNVIPPDLDSNQNVLDREKLRTRPFPI